MINTRLDSKQYSAVYLPFDQSVIIEAPPGHGKTFVMARRIEYLIQSGYIKPPRKILGLTFTNSAAGEMLDDIKARIFGDNVDLIRVMTFHSFGYKILRAYGNLIGVDRDFIIIGENEQNQIFDMIFSQSSSRRNGYLIWFKEKYQKYQSNNADLDNDFVNIENYNKYIEQLGSTKIDFDHILIKLIELFMKYPNVLEIYRSVFRYILIDEFQDTNPIQYKILQLLVSGLDTMSSQEKKSPPPIFILADEYQAIYRFQGATPENMQKAKIDFNCHEITLETNYRCDKEEIVTLLKKFRGINVESKKSRIDFVVSQNPIEEAQLIFKRVNDYKGNLHNICIISQTRYQLEAIRTIFEEQKKPYVFVPDFQSKIVEEKHKNLFDEIRKLSDDKKYHGKLSVRIRELYQESQGEEKGDDVINSIYMLAVNFENRNEKAPFSVLARQFYNDIFIQIHWGNILRKNVRNKIFLSSIHGVKGLQFSQVHICGLSNFEHINSCICRKCNFGQNITSIIEDLSDSKKTLYVGFARAQEQLYLYSTNRSRNDKNRQIICLLSPYAAFFNFVGNAKFCFQLQ